MNCARCGDPMMQETVIKLRRGLFGLRATRSQGAYCATCRISVSVEEQPHRREAGPAANRLFSLTHSRGLQAWRHLGASRQLQPLRYAAPGHNLRP